MQTSAASRKPWLVPLAIVAGLAIVLFLSNREAPTPEGLPIVYDLDTYRREMTNAANQAVPLFIAFDSGRDLSEADKAVLRRCALMFDSVNRFLPNKAGPYLDAGHAYLAVGDLQSAEERLQQCLNNSKLLNTDIKADGVAEAKRLMSMVRAAQGRWQEAYALADEAVKAVPGIPTYYIARASAEVQISQVPQAKADVAKALSIDSTNKRALQLQQLLEEADGTAGKP